MKQKPQHKPHPSSQISELAGTAVHNALARRGRVLAAAELEGVTGGAMGSLLIDFDINGGRMAEKLQVGSLNIASPKIAAEALQGRLQIAGG